MTKCQRAAAGERRLMPEEMERLQETFRNHEPWLEWAGDPRVNIQNASGYAKAYQVKQVVKAIERLKFEHGTKK